MRNLAIDIFLRKLFLFCLLAFCSISPCFSHEIIFKEITIYHPYLIMDQDKKAYAFMSIENTGNENDYLIDIKSKFSSKLELTRIDETGNFSAINLSEGLEIPSGEVLYFEAETLKLIFSEIKNNISWFNPHLAEFVFKNAGSIELEFEVEQ